MTRRALASRQVRQEQAHCRLLIALADGSGGSGSGCLI
jgi:hypothetical protein